MSKKKPAKVKRQPASAASKPQTEANPSSVANDLSKEISKSTWLTLLSILGVIFLWSYWPVIVDLIDQWSRIPDYSHGFLVVPIAVFFLWLTKDSMGEQAAKISWAGAVMILAACGLRVVGAYYYLEALHGWSIPLWLSGVVWMFFGWRAFVWSFPAFAFLLFMVPLPYSVEYLLSQPLQSVSTKISLFMMQCLGLPAMAEGTTILLGDNTLEIERACSGLRIFFGIAALAYAFMLLFKRPLRTNLILILAVLPITLLANSIRIVVTGLFYQLGMDSVAEHITHDLAGLVMIPLAAGLFALTLMYLDRLFPEIEQIDAGSMVRRQSNRKSPSLPH